MKKKIIVVTHERSGTHLLINIINVENKGSFFSVGYINNSQKFSTEKYLYQVEKDINTGIYRDGVIFKSHHQFEFYEKYTDFLFENYYVIYLQREIKDVLLIYYKFLNDKGNKKPIEDFPDLKDWIFMSPDYIGKKILGYTDFPDPHVIINPQDYIDRWLLHVKGWEKYKDNFLKLTYEDILTNFSTTKEKIEDYIHKKVRNNIPSINDKNLPNISPNKGIIGAYKEYMNEDLIKMIDSRVFNI